MKPFPRSHPRSLAQSKRIGEQGWRRGRASIPLVNLSEPISCGIGGDRWLRPRASTAQAMRGRGGWLGLTPWTTCTSYPLPACLRYRSATAVARGVKGEKYRTFREANLPVTPVVRPSVGRARIFRRFPALAEGSNPSDWKCAAWDRAHASGPLRVEPQPGGQQVNDSPR